MVRRALGQQLEAAEDPGIAADLGQRQPGHQQPAQHQQRHLHDIGQRDCLEPAVELVEQGEGSQQVQRGVLVDAGDLGHRDRTQPDDRGQVDEDVQRQPEHRHQRADGRAVTLLEELRHRVDAVVQEDRQEPFADDQQGQRGHPFVRGDRQADRVARAGHADDLFGRDVGGDQRGADRPPRQRLRRQEIIVAVLLVPRFLARDPLRQDEDRDRVDADDRQVDG